MANVILASVQMHVSQLKMSFMASQTCAVSLSWLVVCCFAYDSRQILSVDQTDIKPKICYPAKPCNNLGMHMVCELLGPSAQQALPPYMALLTRHTRNSVAPSL